MDPNEMLKGFMQQAQEDKEANFEVSSLTKVLAQIGWPKAEIDTQKRELDAAFGWGWFNGLGLLSGTRVNSTRVFKFNFNDIIDKPAANHPITQAYEEFRGGLAGPCCLIFKVYDRGTWVATNLACSEDSHIHVVTPKSKFNLVPFPKFFQLRWGDAHAQG